MISIIMPVYNAEKTLHYSVESVVKQINHDWELIAVDDGSIDNSLSLLHRYAEKDNRIKVLHQKNQGPGKARNCGISIATGDYIAFLDSDDYYEQDFLSELNQIIQSSNPDIIFYDCIEEYPNNKSIQCNRLGRFRNKSIPELIRLQMVGTMPWGMVKVVKKELVEKSNQGFSGIEVGEEALFSFELLRKAKKVAFMSKPMYHYIQSDNGQHKKGDIDPWGKVVRNMKDYLVQIGEYDEYQTVINAFAANALTISEYRISISGRGIFNALREMKNMKKNYANEYDLKNVDYSILNNSTKLILFFLQRNIMFPVFMASKVRYRNQ